MKADAPRTLIRLLRLAGLIGFFILAGLTAHGGVQQVTSNADIDYGDPSPPTFKNGKVIVTTTGGFQITWPTEEAFFKGLAPKSDSLKICHADGTPLSLDDGEDIWDPVFEGRDLIGSVMIPPDGEVHAHWPEDNSSRRTFRFRFKKGCWTREPNPLWQSVDGWLGHTYGQSSLEGWRFYERVAEVHEGLPWTTNIYARRGKREILILDSKRWPAAHRSFGGQLVEGARVFKIDDGYLMSFSAGDYNSDRYGLHLLKAKNIEGPYSPILNEDQSDLRNFGEELDTDIEFTWGPGRGVFFERGGKWWLLFHGIRQPFNGDDGHRQLYITPFDLSDL